VIDLAARDAARLASLRRMKATATGLLVFMTIVFIVTRALEDEYSWLSYVRATAEAAMVGALADWFAVTALFRHPLGIPIPHTAIIPNRKDAIGRSLGDFVQHEFLAGPLLIERMRSAGLPRRLGTWMADPRNATKLSATAGDALRSILEVLDDAEVQAGLERALRARVEAIPAAPLAGRALTLAVEGGYHRELVDTLLHAAGEFLDENRDALRARLATESPWWVPEPIDDRIFEKVFGGVHRFLDDLEHDPQHDIRRHFDDRLHELAEQLEHSPDMAARGEDLKHELLAHPTVKAWSASLWADVKKELIAASHDPASALRTRMDAGIVAIGARLRDDPSLQAKVERWLEEAVTFLADEYRDEVATFIATTVEKWDAEETTRKIELQVGRDLQFIRINGTVVGGLAGLLIYSVSRALF
jgi:uncharacterized membrane-anchored protein YjiN (DUF445 family)